MNIALFAPIVAFSCLMPIYDATPTAPTPVPIEIVEVASPRLDNTLRAQLQQAEQSSTDLGTMRAGGISDNEWTWLALGAGIVLLIVLL